MQFSVGDKVVHPGYGPGRITGITSKDLLDGAKHYYVIEIAGQGLTLQMPVSKTDESGMRLAMSQARITRLLSMLRGKPHLLPANYRLRQDQISDQLKTGRVMEVARAVRDLTGHRARAHLTRRDSEYLQLGRKLLATEMALVSGTAVSIANKQIEAAMAVARANTPT